MQRADASNACTHPPVHSVIILSDDAIANWQRRERIFSTRAASLRARPRSARRRFFFSFFFPFLFSKRRSGLTPFTELRRGTRSVNMIKGGRSLSFSPSLPLSLSLFLSLCLCLITRGDLHLYFMLYFTQEGKINANASRVNMLLFEGLLPLVNKRQSFRWLSICEETTAVSPMRARVSNARSQMRVGNVVGSPSLLPSLGSQVFDSRRLLSLQTSNKLRNAVVVYLWFSDLRR